MSNSVSFLLKYLFIFLPSIILCNKKMVPNSNKNITNIEKALTFSFLQIVLDLTISFHLTSRFLLTNQFYLKIEEILQFYLLHLFTFTLLYIIRYLQKNYAQSEISFLNLPRIIKSSIGFFLLFAYILILQINNWLKVTFPDANLTQIVYFIKYPEVDTLKNNVLFESFINSVFIFSFLAIVTLSLITFYIFRSNTHFNFSSFSKMFNRCIIFIILILLLSVNNHFGVSSYINDQKSRSEFIFQNYVDPESVDLVFPKNKRNLIFIYMESMESSYTSFQEGGIRPNNLIPKLTMLGNENINFSHNIGFGGFSSIRGTEWTIASLVSSTAGVPLSVPINGNSYGKTSFLPGIINLGDILDQNGYNQYFTIGSDAEFGGRKTFFESHGNYEIWDYNSSLLEKRKTPEEFVWWGFEDVDLYQYSKEKLTQISKNEEPFNFTMLTVDTHHIDGWLSNSCDLKYTHRFENVINCADEMVFDFVNWITEQDFYENTTIIISGDHLYMYGSDFFEAENLNQRRILNIIINSPILPINEKNRMYTSFDLFPTTLASLGVSIEGDHLGLGVNLFSDQLTLIEKYGFEHVNSELSKKSELYEETFFK